MHGWDIDIRILGCPVSSHILSSHLFLYSIDHPDRECLSVLRHLKQMRLAHLAHLARQHLRVLREGLAAGSVVLPSGERHLRSRHPLLELRLLPPRLPRKKMRLRRKCKS
jgi:hypothetical protein